MVPVTKVGNSRKVSQSHDLSHNARGGGAHPLVFRSMEPPSLNPPPFPPPGWLVAHHPRRKGVHVTHASHRA